MISPEIIHVNYIKKEAQTGSYCGMRYRLSKGKNEEGDCMDVTIWPEMCIRDRDKCILLVRLRCYEIFICRA